MSDQIPIPTLNVFQEYFTSHGFVCADKYVFYGGLLEGGRKGVGKNEIRYFGYVPCLLEVPLLILIKKLRFSK